MKAYKFTRAAIFQEIYQVDANTEEEARAVVEAGDGKVVLSCFTDWASDTLELLAVFEDTHNKEENA